MSAYVSAYVNDPRVVQASATQFDLPDGWHVIYAACADEWRAFPTNGTLGGHVSRNSDEAIRWVIGDPR